MSGMWNCRVGGPVGVGNVRLQNETDLQALVCGSQTQTMAEADYFKVRGAPIFAYHRSAYGALILSVHGVNNTAYHRNLARLRWFSSVNAKLDERGCNACARLLFARDCTRLPRN